MAGRWVSLDSLAHCGIERPSKGPQGQNDSEDPQQASDLVLEVDAVALHPLRVVSSARMWWLSTPFTCTRRYRPDLRI